MSKKPVERERARTENLPRCWGHESETNTICNECVIEMSCHNWTVMIS